MNYKDDLNNIYENLMDGIENTYGLCGNIIKTGYYSTKVISKVVWDISKSIYNAIATSETLKRVRLKITEVDYKKLFERLKKGIIGSMILLSLFSIMPKVNYTYAQTNDKPSIMLDLSHLDNSFDNGSGYAGYTEREIANNITLQVGKELDRLGYSVEYTRSYDKPISINGRVNKANNSSTDLYLSIHANSCKVPNTGTGVEAYTKPGDVLSTYLSDELVNNISNDLRLSNRGVKDSGYYNRSIKASNTLLEIGFINHDSDRDKMLNEQDKYVDAIVKSIENTYITKDVTSISYQHEAKPQKTFNMVKLPSGEWDFIAE